MGRRSQFPGVEQHGHTLRVSFSHQGARCREQLGWAPTAANYARAAKLVVEVERAIAGGTFDYIAYFPNSPRAAKKSLLFPAVAKEWAETLEGELADSTIENYLILLNKHWIPRLKDKSITAITPGDIKRAITAAKFKSAKTRNNAVSVANLVFQYAVGERYITEPPTKGIEQKEHEAPEPDPFTMDEMRDILKWLAQHRDPQTHNYFAFAFGTGMRTGELVQLQWSKVDLRSGYVRVDESRVLQKVKSTKTNRRRDVELSDLARTALVAQKAHTFLAGGHVFLNPNTGDPYYNQQAPWLQLRACLKALKIRHRPAYNTRHTFATMAMMSGSTPYWVSKQLGHASLKMTLEVYAKWITGADDGREVGKLNAFMGQSLGQNGATKGSPGVSAHEESVV